MLKAILHNEIGLASYLVALGKDVHYLRDWADVRIENYPRSTLGISEPSGDEKVVALMEVADVVRLKLSEDTLSPLAILAAMAKPNVAFTEEQLKTFPITEQELIEASIKDTAIQEAVSSLAAGPQAGAGETAAKGGSKALYKYCVDKTSLAREGKLDPIIGRDRETRQVAEILGRRSKPNVIIVGEPGVGKTALVDGFAQNIIAGNVPQHLENAMLLELDVGALIAGASYKGEVEDRIKNIIKEIKQFERAILFIDEIHVLLDGQGSIGPGVANLLKPELARGELTVIGATTSDEYREFIESDEAFNRRFELLRVEEPDVETAVRMLMTLLPHYEAHHETPVAPAALEASVKLSKRYIKDRRLPDAAIDLIDRTMAAIRMMNDTSEAELEALKTEMDGLEAAAETQLKDLQWFYKQLNDKISPILLGQLDDDTEADKIE
ncbi:MAG: ATP-dependent Clp protease ATP-binding subunit, partial [Bacteroidetes bacterium]